MASVSNLPATPPTGMPKNVSRKRKNILPWIVAFLTLILIIISKTAYSAGEQDFRQGMQYYRNRQFSEAFPCFEKAARSGNTEAQSMIGVLYFQGNGVGKDDREAAKWFEKAARAGISKAAACPKTRPKRSNGSKKPRQTAKPAPGTISAPPT